MTGPLTSTLGSLPLAQLPQYFKYLWHSTAELRVQSLHHQQKPNSTPSASASATALHIYQLLQELQHHLQRPTFDFGNLDTQYNITTLTTYKTIDINNVTDPHLHRQYICPQPQQQAWPQQEVQAHRFAIPLRAGHPGYWPCEHPKGYTSQQSGRHLHQVCYIASSWSDIFVTMESLNCTSKRRDQLLPHP